MWLWTAIRWVLALLAVVTLFALFYFIGPNRQPPSWSWLSPGGILATVIWVAASVLFSVYVSHFGGSYAKTYGALAGVIILVLWLYITALAILVGAELNGELERERALRAEAEARGGMGPSSPTRLPHRPAPAPGPATASRAAPIDRRAEVGTRARRGPLVARRRRRGEGRSDHDDRDRGRRRVGCEPQAPRGTVGAREAEAGELRPLHDEVAPRDDLSEPVL